MSSGKGVDERNSGHLEITEIPRNDDLAEDDRIDDDIALVCSTTRRPRESASRTKHAWSHAYYARDLAPVDPVAEARRLTIPANPSAMRARLDGSGTGPGVESR